MKNSVVITPPPYYFLYWVCAFTFCQFHEQMEQRFALEENLNQSSHEDSNTWIQASNNWNPYDELFQMRNQVQQLGILVGGTAIGAAYFEEYIWISLLFSLCLWAMTYHWAKHRRKSPQEKDTNLISYSNK